MYVVIVIADLLPGRLAGDRARIVLAHAEPGQHLDGRRLLDLPQETIRLQGNAADHNARAAVGNPLRAGRFVLAQDHVYSFRVLVRAGRVQVDRPAEDVGNSVSPLAHFYAELRPRSVTVAVGVRTRTKGWALGLGPWVLGLGSC